MYVEAGTAGRVQCGHDQIELGHVRRLRGEGRGERGEKRTRRHSQESKGTKGQVSKMSGLYRKRQPWAGEFKVENGVSQPSQERASVERAAVG